MRISVVITTYNRAEELRLTLEGLTRLQSGVGPDDAHEILVIGNNCTDHTAAVVAEMAPRFNNSLRYVAEPTQGLSHARNRAIAESRYEVIAFLDDDVDVDPGWLRALIAAYEGGDFAAIGGKAHLVYPTTRPSWLTDASEGLLSKVDHGPDPREAEADELYGLNVSFRRDWLKRVGGFRTDLGRMGKCLISGEETELLERIKRAGGRLYYEPGAVVGHRVPHERLLRRWFWSRRYWGGRSTSRLLAADQVSRWSLARASWHLMRAVRIACAAILFDGPRSAAAFEATAKVARNWGAWIELCRRLAVMRRLPAGGLGLPQVRETAP